MARTSLSLPVSLQQLLDALLEHDQTATTMTRTQKKFLKKGLSLVYDMDDDVVVFMQELAPLVDLTRKAARTQLVMWYLGLVEGKVL